MHPKNALKYLAGGAPPPCEGCTWIPLTQGEWALVDNVDAERVLERCWHVQRPPEDTNNTFYGLTNITVDGRRTTITLHRFVATGYGVDEEREVDHHNGQGWDNRRGNLRAANRSQNQTNTPLRRSNKSGYRGVSWDKKAAKWRADIHADGRKRNLGFYVEIGDAHEAYRRAESELRDPEFVRAA